MLTREEASKRLTHIETEIAELREALDRAWSDGPASDPTQVFLSKCGGWEDDRTPEEIIADIYSSRTVSDRAAKLFDEDAE